MVRRRVRNSERATGNPELIETATQRTEETERGDLRYRGKLAWCPTNNDTSTEEHAMLGMPALTRRHCSDHGARQMNRLRRRRKGYNAVSTKAFWEQRPGYLPGRRILRNDTDHGTLGCRSPRRQNHLELIALDLPTLTTLVPEERPDVPTNPEILDHDSNVRVADKVEQRRRSIRSSSPDSPRQKIEH